MAKRFTASDGKLVLTLEEAEEGGFVVTSPMYPGLTTQGEDLVEAFEMAHDALKTFARAGREWNESAPNAARRD